MPYAKHQDEPKMPALIRDMNAESLAFTVFDGDTKNGASVCSDEAIGQRAISLFNQTRVPTIYVPSDNEWTDCHRLSNGGYDALECLRFIRQHMFNAEQSFGKRQLPFLISIKAPWLVPTARIPAGFSDGLFSWVSTYPAVTMAKSIRCVVWSRKPAPARRRNAKSTTENSPIAIGMTRNGWPIRSSSPGKTGRRESWSLCTATPLPTKAEPVA